MTGYHARIVSIYNDGSTSSVVGKFDSKNAALERARNEIEMPGSNRSAAVAVLVLTTDPIGHYEAVESGVRNGIMRYKAEKAIGFRER